MRSSHSSAGVPLVRGRLQSVRKVPTPSFCLQSAIFFRGESSCLFALVPYVVRGNFFRWATGKSAVFRRLQQGRLPRMGTVPQQCLRLIQRMPGIHEKRGKGVPQAVNAHIGKSQFSPELVPEQIEIGKRLSLCMAGKQPRIAGSAGHGANNFQGGIGQKDIGGLSDLDNGTVSSCKSRRACSQRALRISLLRAPVSRSRRRATASGRSLFSSAHMNDGPCHVLLLGEWKKLAILLQQLFS